MKPNHKHGVISRLQNTCLDTKILCLNSHKCSLQCANESHQQSRVEKHHQKKEYHMEVSGIALGAE